MVCGRIAWPYSSTGGVRMETNDRGSHAIEAVELVNGDSEADCLLVCEHAGRAVPDHLDGLGLDDDVLCRHIGWDIGAGDVTRLLAERLGAPAVLQRYSRLVIDCNRPTDAPDSIAPISDGVTVPGNLGLSDDERAWRIARIFQPFHQAVVDLLEQPGRRAVFAIHSFTPALGGVDRPWDAGFLYRRDKRTGRLLGEALAAEQPSLRIGYNQPYQIDDRSDWFVPVHGEARGLPHSLIEIRNDHIRDRPGVVRWAEDLAKAIAVTMEAL